jgi:hypothetical protein
MMWEAVALLRAVFSAPVFATRFPPWSGPRIQLVRGKLDLLAIVVEACGEELQAAGESQHGVGKADGV